MARESPAPAADARVRLSTGVIVDAAGHLGLDRVFPGNMTGIVAVPDGAGRR
jgi:hypothetical protein